MTYEKILESYCQKHPEAIVLTAENRALIRNLPPRLGPRFIDTGITEQTMVGMAAGLASQGHIVICHALATFLTMRAFEFIRTDVGIAGLPVKFTGYIPGLLSEANGPTHQALEDMALMLGIPGMEVYCPADLEDMVLMCEAVWDSPNPAYFRAVHLPSGLSHEPYQYGKVEWILQNSGGVTFLVAGFLLGEVLKAAHILQQKGVPCSVVNMRSLRPLDNESVERAFRQSEVVIAVEDHFQFGGLFTVLSLWLRDHTDGSGRYSGRWAPLRAINFQERWFTPALLADVLDCEMLSAEHIAARAENLLMEEKSYREVGVPQKQ
ncbi:MAG: transketolase C-terminal domain-containing protein [Chitinophagales bacterium]|nr:transketolase C-terminal domain-containing protein [Chitinophagales bacterium]